MRGGENQKCFAVLDCFLATIFKDETCTFNLRMDQEAEAILGTSTKIAWISHGVAVPLAIKNGEIDLDPFFAYCNNQANWPIQVRVAKTWTFLVRLLGPGPHKLSVACIL